MEFTCELKDKKRIAAVGLHENAPIPQDGEYVHAREVKDLSGFSHSVATCGLKQGACKLSLNIKDGIVEEALIETIGCSGMTQSAAMAAEILPGKTLLEAMNTDLVCDAINVAMREFFLAMAYGRTQTAYSKGGLAVGAAMEDLGRDTRSMVGTSYGTREKGPRYLELSEGYVTRLALDSKDEIIGYEAVDTGKMMNLIRQGTDANEALKKAAAKYGRFDEGVNFIDPRKE